MNLLVLFIIATFAASYVATWFHNWPVATLCLVAVGFALAYGQLRFPIHKETKP